MVESFSIDDSETTLTIEGLSLPEDIISISFTNVDCEDITFDQTIEISYSDEVDEEGNAVLDEFNNTVQVETFTVTGSTITCTMTDDLTAGEFYPEILTEYGIIPTDEAVDSYVKDMVVTSIDADATLNLMGGDTIIIYGEAFPSRLNDGSELSIELDDGTACEITRVSSTEIRCVTNRL